MLALPERHNGRYLFTVQGGAAGFVPDPTESHLKAGYAIASTDKGVVTPHGLDFSFRANKAMELDWAHRGVHVAAVATQELARGYYPSARLYRYVMGCSGGGDGTLTEAEMYPDDFDAHVAGAMNTDYPYGTTVTWAAIGQRVNRVEDAWISRDEYRRIHNVLLKQFDADDGASDGLVWDPRVIELDRKALNFLSDAQFGTLQLIQDGVRDREGNWLSPGFWLANPVMFPNFLTGRTPPPWETQQDQPGGVIVADTSSKASHGSDFSYVTDVDFDSPESVAGAFGPGTKFDHTRLAKLKQAGHKLILWVGAAEEAVSPQQIVGYTEKASVTFGAGTRETFLRTFIVPGMHHCSRGDGAPTDTVPRMLEVAQAWVEDGRAPDAVTLSNDTRTFRLCPYPQRSVFEGGVENPNALDVNDAKNWRCQS